MGVALTESGEPKQSVSLSFMSTQLVVDTLSAVVYSRAFFAFELPAECLLVGGFLLFGVLPLLFASEGIFEDDAPKVVESNRKVAEKHQTPGKFSPEMHFSY